MSRFVVGAALCLLLPAVARAQKRVLTQADWDRWRSISGAALSSDGKWAVYSLTPAVGDGELIIRSTTSATEYRIPRGYLSRPNNLPGGLRPPQANPEEEPQVPIIASAQLTADGKYAVALTFPKQEEFDRVARDRQRSAAIRNRSDLAIVRLADGNVTTISGVRSFRLPKASGVWLAYVIGDSAGAAAGAADSTTRGGTETAGRSETRRRFGSALVLRNIALGSEERIEDVLDFAFDDSAKVFVYAVVSRTPQRDGAYLRNLTTGSTSALLTGTGDFDQVAIDRAATQVAFVSNRDDFEKTDRPYTLYCASVKEGIARPSVTPMSLNGMRVSRTANVSFTRAGNAVVFGMAPPRIDSLPVDSLAGKAVFDLWHYKDAELQPTQRINAARDRNRTFQAVYHVALKRVVRLTNDSLPDVSISDDGRVAIANSRARYSIPSMWGDGGTDVYTIDGLTGRITLLREKITGSAQLSPDAKYVALFDAGKWFVHSLATGRTIDVTAPLTGVSFARETWDAPSPAPAWGLTGWTKGDRSVLLYDRWDIWEVDPAGVRAPVMVTDSLGRKTSVSMRLVLSVAPGGGAPDEDRGIDPRRPLLLRSFNETTKSMGFARDWLGVVRPPEQIVTADVRFGPVIKAKDAEQYLVTRGTFVDFPNLYTGTSLANLTRISDANPQQKDYKWGTVELVSWTSLDGVPLKGLLFKPEDFDSTKKYPMITYVYEQLSSTLHAYVPPSGSNIINPTHYVSNGYLVFEPDIRYEAGYPGQSALKSVIPGINLLVARGFVDPKRLGMQGHSWGGYQTLYLITQTHIFSAAMAGAPVVNMTSAYGGIRWASGAARPSLYEAGQSRIGGSIWKYPTRFIENSPLFWLDRVTTPLLVMANDADNAVPWYQGIELFVDMRRLGKEVYLINYNNDVHNPASRANQKDIAMRMQQFFDHHLRGMPAPEWMTKGIPYLSKGRDQVPGAAVAGGVQPNP